MHSSSYCLYSGTYSSEEAAHVLEADVAALVDLEHLFGLQPLVAPVHSVQLDVVVRVQLHYQTLQHNPQLFQHR